ncbi:MAG: hypothetical protein H0W31_04610 [Actinobacteria bacterium]|nr:hypothetical protein [Actinomycetota bacterium]
MLAALDRSVKRRLSAERVAALKEALRELMELDGVRAVAPKLDRLKRPACSAARTRRTSHVRGNR